MGIGRLLILTGLALVAAGLLFTYAGSMPVRLGRLPGDFLIHGKRTTFYFPLTTCVLISLAASVLVWLFRR